MARASIKFDFKAIERKEQDYWIRKMQNDCKKLVQAAFMSAEFKEQTGNLADSIGAAVYQDGKLLENTIAYRTPRATQTNDWYGVPKDGHNEMIQYFRNYKPRAMGLTIVLVAAMPYSEVLEKRKSNLTRKYKVITGAYSALKALQSEYQQELTKRRYKTAKYGQGIRVSLNTIDV